MRHMRVVKRDVPVLANAHKDHVGGVLTQDLAVSADLGVDVVGAAV